jgi:hypothetical protein
MEKPFMTDEQKLRQHIRKVLNEEINNYLDKEEETNTRQLEDNSKPELIGDPLDVELNQLADELGSDGDIAPAVAVKAGSVKGGNDFTTGQQQPQFADKTKLAK